MNPVQKWRTLLLVLVMSMVMVAGVLTAGAGGDTSKAALRAGTAMMVAGAVLLLPWRASLPIAIIAWLATHFFQSLLTTDHAFLNAPMLEELPVVATLAALGMNARAVLCRLEATTLAQANVRDAIDPATGVFEAQALHGAMEAELTRSRRFSRPFALVLVDIDERHQRFDYRDEDEWDAGFKATAQLLLRTRAHIDRVYRYGATGFALLLPESAEREVTGLVKRLRKQAAQMAPRDGRPGGPLPVAFGATFYPHCASTVEDLLRRAELALRLAAKNSNRLQLDGAEAAALPPPETLRKADDEEPAANATAIDVASDGVTPVAAAVAESGPEAASSGIEKPAASASEPLALEPSLSGASSVNATAPLIHAEPTVSAELSSEELQDSSASPASGQGPMSDEEITLLLGRMNETLELIRELREKAA